MGNLKKIKEKAATLRKELLEKYSELQTASSNEGKKIKIRRLIVPERSFSFLFFLSSRLGQKKISHIIRQYLR